MKLPSTYTMLRWLLQEEEKEGNCGKTSILDSQRLPLLFWVSYRKKKKKLNLRDGADLKELKQINVKGKGKCDSSIDSGDHRTGFYK